MRRADSLPLSCAVVTKSGSLNFLEPSGPVQACNGTALPFTNFSKLSVVSMGFFIVCVIKKVEIGLQNI